MSAGMSSCGKVTYTSKAAAKRIGRRASANGGTRMEPYRCESCDGWHIGHGGQTPRPCRDCGEQIVLLREQSDDRMVPYDPVTRTWHKCRNRIAGIPA